MYGAWRCLLHLDALGARPANEVYLADAESVLSKDPRTRDGEESVGSWLPLPPEVVDDEGSVSRSLLLGVILGGTGGYRISPRPSGKG